MIPLILLIVSLLVFRGLGELGVSIFSSWQDSARYALALMFLFTASAHFTSMKEDLIRMIPKTFPYPRQIVFLTGIFEVMGAIGLLIPATKNLAGAGLVLLMIAMFPANVNAAINKMPLRGKPPTPLWMRIPMQIIFISLTWWASR